MAQVVLDYPVNGWIGRHGADSRARKPVPGTVSKPYGRHFPLAYPL